MNKLFLFVVFLFIACGVSDEREPNSSNRATGGGKTDGDETAPEPQQDEADVQMMSDEMEEG